MSTTVVALMLVLMSDVGSELESMGGSKLLVTVSIDVDGRGGAY
jgi:hypothetical protein